MKIALVYDRVNKFGGAERLLRSIHQVWPRAPLYTAVYDPRGATWAKKINVKSSFLQTFPLAKTHHELYPWLMSAAFESFDFRAYDVVLSVTSADAKAVITKPETLHLCYCLTPTRYLWSHEQNYFNAPGLGNWSLPAKLGLKLLKPHLQKNDLLISSRPDKYLAISQAVRKRIKAYYGQESKVIYPPVNFQYFQKTKASNLLQWLPEKYWLVVSRLVSYKNISLAIEAFNQLQWPLVVVGDGRQKNQLQKQAKANVIFAGQQSNQDLRYLYQQAQALIMPQDEDFGIVALEAQSCGVPVVALGRGGALETVLNQKTGIFFFETKVDSLVKAVKKSRSRTWDKKIITAQAQNFDSERFKQEIKKYVETAWLKHQQK